MRIVPLGVLLLAAFATAPAQADVPEARGLYGAPTMVVAQQLGRRGFQMVSSYSSRGMNHSMFLHPNTGRCLMQSERNNATVSIVEQPMQACTGKSPPVPPAYGGGYNPGYQGPMNGDIYAEFIGARSRDVERELRRRGYRRMGGRGGMQYWWAAERDICAVVYAEGGYIRQMNPEDPRACRR